MITLGQLHALSLELAIDRGPVSRKEVEEDLKRIRKEYGKLDAKKKRYFDKERLINPILDSRIEFGDPNTGLKRVLVGIDIMVGDLLMAKELGREGKKFDAVIAHHPEGKGLISLEDVMPIQDDIAVLDGVPVNIAEKLMKARLVEVNRWLHSYNDYRIVDAARLLNMPFMCLHTIADHNCYWFLKNFITKKNPKYLGELMDSVMELPEYQEAARRNNAPRLYVGDKKSRVGKLSFSGITGGTTGPKEIYEKMAIAGVGTMIVMHIPDEHRKLAQKYHINVVVLSHMASDSIGVNLLMDEAEKKGTEIVACGGFIRVSRV